MIQSLLLALAVAAPAAAAAPVAPRPPDRDSHPAVPSRADERVLVLGFDGADYRTTARMIEAGEHRTSRSSPPPAPSPPCARRTPPSPRLARAAINTGRNPVENIASRASRQPPHRGLPPCPTRRTSRSSPTSRSRSSSLMGSSGSSPGAARSSPPRGRARLRPRRLPAAGPRARHQQAPRGRARAARWRGRWLVGGGCARERAHRGRGRLPEQGQGGWLLGPRGRGRRPCDRARCGPRVRSSRTLPTRVLGGLGLPDVRGGISGEWFVYTSDDIWFDSGPKGERAGDTGS